MMNKKTKIYVLVLIWAAIVLQLFINSAINREDKMVEQVMAQGVDNLVEGSVKAYAYYGDEQLSGNAKELIAKNIAKELSVTSGYEISHKQDGENETTVLTKLGALGDTKIKIISLGGSDEYGNQITENYIMTEIKLKGPSGSAANEYKEIVDTLYTNLGMNANTNMYLCSQVKGELTESEMNEQINEFLENMSAIQIERVEFDDVICVYGYTRNIDEYVYQDNNRVNVNIAFSYDEVEDITFVHRAVPFVDKSF